ncbi:hypothetical protein ACOMHN_052826 [Nucella lapillus]
MACSVQADRGGENGVQCADWLEVHEARPVRAEPSGDMGPGQVSPENTPLSSHRTRLQLWCRGKSQHPAPRAIARGGPLRIGVGHPAVEGGKTALPAITVCPAYLCSPVGRGTEDETLSLAPTQRIVTLSGPYTEDSHSLWPLGWRLQTAIRGVKVSQWADRDRGRVGTLQVSQWADRDRRRVGTLQVSATNNSWADRDRGHVGTLQVSATNNPWADRDRRRVGTLQVSQWADRDRRCVGTLQVSDCYLPITSWQ